MCLFSFTTTIFFFFFYFLSFFLSKGVVSTDFCVLSAIHDMFRNASVPREVFFFSIGARRIGGFIMVSRSSGESAGEYSRSWNSESNNRQISYSDHFSCELEEITTCSVWLINEAKSYVCYIIVTCPKHESVKEKKEKEKKICCRYSWAADGIVLRSTPFLSDDSHRDHAVKTFTAWGTGDLSRSQLLNQMVTCLRSFIIISIFVFLSL